MHMQLVHLIYYVFVTYRCAAINQNDLAKGRYVECKVNCDDHQASVFCPRGVVKKPDDLKPLVNQFTHLQIENRERDTDGGQ